MPEGTDRPQAACLLGELGSPSWRKLRKMKGSSIPASCASQIVDLAISCPYAFPSIAIEQQTAGHPSTAAPHRPGAMADASLQSLLSTKAALDLGLVSQADFDAVKNAFLRAQQIKSALDVGLIKPEDYEETKRSFLGSLIGGGAAAVTAPAASAAPPPTAAAPAAPAPQPPAAPTAAPEPPAARPPPVAWTLPPPAPKVAAPAPQAAQPPAPAAAPAAAERRPAANPGVPSNIPKMGGIKAQAQGVSGTRVVCGGGVGWVGWVQKSVGAVVGCCPRHNLHAPSPGPAVSACLRPSRAALPPLHTHTRTTTYTPTPTHVVSACPPCRPP